MFAQRTCNVLVVLTADSTYFLFLVLATSSSSRRGDISSIPRLSPFDFSERNGGELHNLSNVCSQGKVGVKDSLLPLDYDHVAFISIEQDSPGSLVDNHKGNQLWHMAHPIMSDHVV